MALVCKYQNDMTRKELLLNEEETGQVPEYYENMLLYNDIEQVIPYTIRQIDHQKWYVYNVTGKQSVSESLMHQKIGFIPLRELCREMIRLINHCREYLLDEKDFLLHSDYLFWKDDETPLYLCVFPGYGREVREQLAELFEYFMNRIDYHDRRAVMMVYELYMKSKEGSCTFEDILEIICKNEGAEEDKQNHYEKETEKQIPDNRKQETVSPESKIMYVRESFHKAETKEVRSGWKQYLPEFLFQTKNEKQKTVKKEKHRINTEAQKTMLLYPMRESSLYCLHSKTAEGRSIYIDKFPYYIGKAGANVNHEMTASTISRIHARLTQIGEGVYLEDMQSSNGSFVNEVRLTANEVKKLENGDCVRLADQCFRYEKQESDR